MPTTEGEPPTKGEQLALFPKSKAPQAAKQKLPPKKKTKIVKVKSMKYQGEPSSINEFKPCLIDPPSPVKPHGENKFVEDFPMPKFDKSKVLGLAIHMGKFGKKWDESEEDKKERERAEKGKADQVAKDLAEGKPVKPKLVIGKLDLDTLWRSEFAYITRNNETICVPPGHSLYAKAKEEQERNKRPSTTDDAKIERFASQLQDELDEELFGLADDESNISIQQQILDEAKKNLEKKKKPKKARDGVKNIKSNLTVEPQDETVNVPKQDPPPPTSEA